MSNPIGGPQKRISIALKYREVFNTPVGRDVLTHICKSADVFTTTFVAGDPYRTALHEGQRRLALAILKQLNIDTIEQLNQLDKYERPIDSDSDDGIH